MHLLKLYKVFQETLFLILLALPLASTVLGMGATKLYQRLCFLLVYVFKMGVSYYLVCKENEMLKIYIYVRFKNYYINKISKSCKTSLNAFLDIHTKLHVFVFINLYQLSLKRTYKFDISILVFKCIAFLCMEYVRLTVCSATDIVL